MHCCSACALAHHTPRQIGHRTKGFLIHKVTPATYTLSDKKAYHSYIQNRQKLHFLDFCNCKSTQKGTDYSTVYGKSALIDIENFNRIFAIVIPLKEAEIQPCTDNSRYYTDQNTVNKLILINFIAFCTYPRIQNSKHKT